MRVTEEKLRRGETVYLRRHTSGSLCLLVERGGLTHTVMRDDGHVRLFDSRGEAEFYCLNGGFVLEEQDKPVLVGERKLLSAPECEEPRLTLNLEVEESIHQAVIKGIKRHASWDLENLAFLIDERERLRVELEAELERRRALGNKSCLCPGCINRLSYPLREVQEKIDRIWSWWATSLGTTPADVTAGRWT